MFQDIPSTFKYILESDRKHNVPEEVVLKIMNDQLNYGKTMVTDNWYISLDLT